MKVAELKKMLESIPDDLPIMMSIDPEGNGFYPLGEIEADTFYVDGEVLTEDELKAHEVGKFPKVVAFWAGYDFPKS